MTDDQDFEERTNLEDNTRAARRIAAAADTDSDGSGFAQKFTIGVVIVCIAIIAGMVIGGLVGGLIYLMNLIFSG